LRIVSPVAKAGDKFLLYPHFGRAPYFAVVEAREGKIESIEAKENPYRSHEHGRGAGIIDFILSLKPDAVLSLGMGNRAFEHLRDAGVKVYFYPSREDEMPKLSAAVEALLRGELREAAEAYEPEEDEGHEGHHWENLK